MSQRALITGVTGFAGGFLAEHLLDQGDVVLGTAIDATWSDASPIDLRGKVELVAWDISQDISDEAWQAIESFAPNVLYHLAAISVPSECGDQEPTALATAVNVEGTRRAVDLAARLPSRPRLLFTSSAYVYARVDPGDPLVNEQSPLGPRRPYGRLKLAAEEEVRRGIERSGIDGVIVRAFQHAGPRQDARMMLSEWSRQFAEGTNPVRVHTLDATMDLTDVCDVVRAYRLIATHGVQGETFNVGSGVPRRSGDVFDILRRLADPNRQVVQTKPGAKHDPIAYTTRLRQRTAWQPRIPIEQTVADTYAWWLKSTVQS
jgi:GDP-4-dehydro-6-deoxy-D-mannose reductase